MISPGASMGHRLALDSPELFVPPGMAPSFHYPPTDCATWPAGTFPGLWGGAISQTFGQAHALWDKKPAIEMSLLLPGLAPWRGDMTPFACVTQPLCCWCVAIFNAHFLTWVCSLAAMLRWYAVTKVSSATSVA